MGDMFLSQEKDRETPYVTRDGASLTHGDTVYLPGGDAEVIGESGNWGTLVRREISRFWYSTKEAADAAGKD